MAEEEKKWYTRIGAPILSLSGLLSSMIAISEFVADNVAIGQWTIDARLVRWLLTWFALACGLTFIALFALRIRDVVQSHKERKLEKEAFDRQQDEIRKYAEEGKAEKQRKYILDRFDWLLRWHTSQDTATERDKSVGDRVADETQSIEFMVDLKNQNLISPKVSDTPRGNRDLVIYLAAARKKYELRGLSKTQALAKLWDSPPTRESTIDTSAQ